MLENRADSHTSAARFVRPHDWQKKPTDEKKLIGAKALNPAGKTTPLKYPPILYDDCEQDTTAKKTMPMKSTWHSRLPMCEKC